MNVEEVMEAFRNPDPVYRTMPQWSWNGELSEARITEQLEQFAEQGAGGLFPHARPGLITAYISDEWFRMWGHGAREADRLGLGFHIYDEFCCPGGHAGGHVVAQKPHLVQQVVELDVVTDPVNTPSGDVLAWFRWDRDDGSVNGASAGDVASATNGAPLLALVQRAGEHRPEKGGFALPDMLRRETAETFIATTHDRYAEHCGEQFGKTVRFVFCDEPQIFGARDAWPFSQHLLRAFRHDHGYELTDRLGALCFGLDGAPEVRFDYWWTVNRLYNDNFMQTLHDWCEEHDLLFTGHLMENTWPSPRLQPDTMASLRWMHAPGADLLGFQFTDAGPEENGLYLLNMKEVSSVAAQLGREWILTESCGGAGYEAAFDVFKPLEDYLLALGVNVMDPHLGHQTLSGSRKYDWPQTLSDHSPWWRHYRDHADHVARVNAALSQGVERNRVLVLQPTTTAWLHYAPEPFRLGDEDNPLDNLERSQTDLVLALYGAQVDFDLGDEFILEEFGSADAGRLKVGERSYELIVIPPGMENLTVSTLGLLSSYLAEDGKVLCVGDPPERVDGRPSDEPAALAGAHPAQWSRVADMAALVEAVRERVPPRISGPDGETLPPGLCWRRLELTDGSLLYFFCNPWTEPIETDVKLETSCPILLDTRRSQALPLTTSQGRDPGTVRLNLPPHGHALILCADSVPASVRSRTDGAPQDVELRPAGAPERLADNVLILDYCDLETEGRRFEGVNTLHADRLNWPLQGFDRNPWQQAHQFNRTVIDRPVPADSGFSVTYRFSLADDLDRQQKRGLRVGIERPWLYTVRINGHVLTQESAERWFDEQMRAFPVGRYVQPGDNELVLTAEPFHVLCEIMPAYLIGDFGLRPAERGFDVTAPRTLEPGEWAAQGLPFYPDAVRYSYQFRLVQERRTLLLRLADWAGSVAVARVDGGEKHVTYPHEAAARIEGEFQGGQHLLTVDVLGNMRNFMGPHHAEGLPGAWTWALAPESQPPGEDYIIQPCGLMAPPEVTTFE
ncbi:MAG: glycosyl hydrolase [Candidatus Brocadiia bacterium]